MCVPCHTLMEQRSPSSHYVHCPACDQWFPVVHLTVNHQDRDMKRMWEFRWVANKQRWVRVSKGPGPDPDAGSETPSPPRGRAVLIDWDAPPSSTVNHEVKPASLGDPLTLAAREKQWDRYGRCGFTDQSGSRCRYVDNGHRFHLCVPVDNHRGEGDTV